MYKCHDFLYRTPTNLYSYPYKEDVIKVTISLCQESLMS